MKTLRRVSTVAALVAGLAGSGLPLVCRAAEPNQELLIDFTDNRLDRDGTVYHAYEYAFGDWNKHVFDLPRRGVLLKGPNGKGGIGENKTAVDFDGCDMLTLHYVVGNTNEARSISFSLEDRDGTEQTWVISLEGLVAGREVRQRLDVAKPDRQDKPGKKPGMDLKRASTWQVKGDWTDPKVEVLLIKLTGEK